MQKPPAKIKIPYGVTSKVMWEADCQSRRPPPWECAEARGVVVALMTYRIIKANVD